MRKLLAGQPLYFAMAIVLVVFPRISTADLCEYSRISTDDQTLLLEDLVAESASAQFDLEPFPHTWLATDDDSTEFPIPISSADKKLFADFNFIVADNILAQVDGAAARTPAIIARSSMPTMGKRPGSARTNPFQMSSYETVDQEIPDNFWQRDLDLLQFQFGKQMLEPLEIESDGQNVSPQHQSPPRLAIAPVRWVYLGLILCSLTCLRRVRVRR